MCQKIELMAYLRDQVHEVAGYKDARLCRYNIVATFTVKQRQTWAIHYVEEATVDYFLLSPDLSVNFDCFSPAD